MNKFKELIATLAELDGADLPETMFADIDGAYDSDVSVREARIEELTKQYDEAVANISTLKNELYDLSKAVTSDDTDEGSEDNDESLEGDETPDLEDFFEEIK